jgi:cytochrome P450
MVLKQHGTEWRSDRRFTHLALNTDAVKQYHAIQEQHVHTYLQNLLERPDNFMHDLHRYVTRIWLSEEVT